MQDQLISRMGTLLDIQRFSVHDGPGIRDLVIMKGCPLRCVWCCNPESQSHQVEISFIESRCIGWKECKNCLEICPVGAITAHDSKIIIDRKLCTNCGQCVMNCPAKAIRLLGEQMSIGDVVNIIEEDSIFFTRSGGGVTIGGGEALAQAEFVSELLQNCLARGVNTAIETCGQAPWEDVEKVCKYTNLILYDIKHMDAIKHKAYAGVTNERVLENIIKISQRFPDIPIIARTPVIPGLNDSEGNIKAAADFLSKIGSLQRYELLPYHSFGEPKYRQLGRSYPLVNLEKPSTKHLMKLKNIVQRTGISCEILL